jgi:hypothetical protein
VEREAAQILVLISLIYLYSGIFFRVSFKIALDKMAIGV